MMKIAEPFETSLTIAERSTTWISQRQLISVEPGYKESIFMEIKKLSVLKQIIVPKLFLVHVVHIG